MGNSEYASPGSGRLLRPGVRLPSLILPMILGLVLAGPRAEAADGPVLIPGLQAALALPMGEDLRLTTGSGPCPIIGLHATWILDEHQALRPRLDLMFFDRDRQEVAEPLPQRIDTRVQGTALGVEYLYRPQGNEGRWAVGAGLYLIRWSVTSTNRIRVPGSGTTETSGTARWTREGLGLVTTWRLTPRLDLEGRWIASHYGYENLPARLGTIGLLFHF